MKKRFGIVFLLLLFLVFFVVPPLAGQRLHSRLQQLLPRVEAALAERGLTLHIADYRSGFFRSRAHWQLKSDDYTILTGTLRFDHAPFSAAGFNLARARLTADLAAEDLQVTLRLSPDFRLLAEAFLTNPDRSRNFALHAAARLWRIENLTLTIDSRTPRLVQNETLPPFALHAVLQSRKKHDDGTRLPPPLRLLLQRDNLLTFTLHTRPENAAESLHLSGEIREHIDNPLQLAALQQRTVQLALLDQSALTLQLPADHPDPQSVAAVFARPPLLLDGELRLKDDKWQIGWKILQQQLHQIN